MELSSGLICFKETIEERYQPCKVTLIASSVNLKSTHSKAKVQFCNKFPQGDLEMLNLENYLLILTVQSLLNASKM